MRAGASIALALVIAGCNRERGAAADAVPPAVAEGTPSSSLPTPEAAPGASVTGMPTQPPPPPAEPAIAAEETAPVDGSGNGADANVASAVPDADASGLPAPVDTTAPAPAAAVDVAGLPHFTVWPTTVRVSGEVDLRMQRALANVPVRGSDGSVRGSADLRLTGPSRVLAELGPQVWIEESGATVRIRGVPASVTATLVTRRAAVDPVVDSATAP